MAKRRFIAILLMAMVILSGCQSQALTPTISNATKSSPTIRLALLPILDALPIYVAQDKGYFAQEGIQVSFVAANSAVERDQIMQANQADGMINDLVSVMLYDRDQIQVQVIRFAQVATSTQPVYRIVVSAKSQIRSVQDLKGVEIGISQGSVIEYVTDRLLEANGIDESQIKTVAVPKISDRLTLLGSGQIQAATLPEPFSTQAIQNGGVSILDDTGHPEYGNSVITFRKAFIDAHPNEITAFLKAIDLAVKDINADSTGWQAILKQYTLVPDDLLSTYQVPTFPTYSLPTQNQCADVIAWAKAKGLIGKDLNYADLIYKGQ